MSSCLHLMVARELWVVARILSGFYDVNMFHMVTMALHNVYQSVLGGCQCITRLLLEGWQDFLGACQRIDRWMLGGCRMFRMVARALQLSVQQGVVGGYQGVLHGSQCIDMWLQNVLAVMRALLGGCQGTLGVCQSIARRLLGGCGVFWVFAKALLDGC